MKKLLLMTLAVSVLGFSSCGDTPKSENPFFTQWNTPYGVPPFDAIQTEHYMPAIEEGMRLEKLEIDSIINNPETPTFDNTIVAYTQTGEFLGQVSMVFGGITGTDMTPELESLQGEISKKMTAHRSDISLNDSLFQRIKTVYDSRENAGLDSMQIRLTEKVYKGFERNGANLTATDKEKLRELDSKLSQLSIQFGKNLRAENGGFVMIVDNKDDLAGLSESIIAAAASEAVERGQDGKWAFTLDKSSMIPFLQYSENSALREKLYKGYLERCNNNNDNDNKNVIGQIASNRLKRAQLLGYPNHSAFVLDVNMAKDPAAVYALLETLWTPAVGRAKAELAEMKKLKTDGDFQSWDWWFYAEKLRAQKFNLDQEQLRPYFALPNVLNGIFDLTTKLYGITYKDVTASVPTYNKENKVYEVFDNDGSHLGVVYFDFHPRAGKRVGAWCTSFRGQKYKNGKKITPIVSIVCNFTKPVGNQVALLNLDEVETLFHEYGHGLHSLFRDVKYQGLGGVERDFVELPSQIMENWAFEPKVLATYAKHYQTGEVIPTELVEKIQNSALFNQGFATVEYLGASLLDLDYHTLTEDAPIDVMAFENASLSKYGAMNEIAPRYRSTYFQHIFSGGYSSGYYSYIWAEVLDADAYQAFVDSGDLFNPEIAKKFRNEVLSQGGQADGGVLYQNFRGAAPSREPLMKKRGLI